MESVNATGRVSGEGIDGAGDLEREDDLSERVPLELLYFDCNFWRTELLDPNFIAFSNSAANDFKMDQNLDERVCHLFS